MAFVENAKGSVMTAPLVWSPLPQYILYKLAPKNDGGGKVDKLPLDPRTQAVVSAHDPAIWMEREEAESVAALLGLGHGVGFVFTPEDDHWFLDIDACLVDGQWSTTAVELCNRFHGAYVEVSQSGTGLHLIGRGQPPEHGTKSTPPGVELYSRRRFCALTGTNASGDMNKDFTAEITALAIERFPPTAGSSATPGDWSESPCEGYGGPVDDDELIRLASRSQSAAAAFGGRPTFKHLWEADEAALGRAFPDDHGGRPYDASRADAALAQRLAFWTGKDCARVQRLMERSALARSKWTERPDYLTTTVLKAYAQQREVATGKQTQSEARPEATAIWLEPEPLTRPLEPQPYPVDALPAAAQAAVIEVQGFVQAPMAMVGCAALSALSIVIQPLVDVQRAAGLAGPTSLYTLVIAESGERKSTLDSFFTKTIRNWETQATARMQSDVQKHEAAKATWDAKHAGLREAIKAGAKNGGITTEHEAALRGLEAQKPVAPLVPKMLRMDDTSEALAYQLAHEWPAAAVLSSEGGMVFGSHGMKSENLMRNISLLNMLWEGGVVPISRRTSESFTVQNARLSIALQIQDATFRAFFDGTEGLARGSGFLARFLFTWPHSTQGLRLFVEPPAAWPALSRFNERIAKLLNTPILMAPAGGVQPILLTMAPDAKAAWVAFHDAVEVQLGIGGHLTDMRDVASKIADNAGRIAGLFHVFEIGTQGEIGVAHMAAAICITRYHLNEARRFFGEIALPEPIADAVRIERYMIDCCRRNGTDQLRRRDLQREGPIRDGRRLDAALGELTSVHRARLFNADGRKSISVNPALLRNGLAE